MRVIISYRVIPGRRRRDGRFTNVIPTPELRVTLRRLRLLFPIIPLL